MNDLEIKALKAQMNPHFIFNALNSIQQFVLAGQGDQAYDSISKFSKLIRKMLESNVQENINLENEIDLLNKYIDVEALRFENGFEYSIVMEGNFSIRGIFIPHMLIQPFVENAIWHGLAHKENHRKLTILFMKLDEYRLLCIIDDNGVGREYSKKRSLNKGKVRSLAIDFTRERLAILSQVHNRTLGLKIYDKKTSTDESNGTVVEIIIPILKE